MGCNLVWTRNIWLFKLVKRLKFVFSIALPASMLTKVWIALNEIAIMNTGPMQTFLQLDTHKKLFLNKNP